ncbi:hypothetical protein SAMN02927924_04657 [Sphingobium faniae]|nr:hypothetical protein SAMN02927924_04657 [Sphingobium faniae]
MPHSTVTPETVFCPKPASLGDSVFCFGQAAPRLSEQEQYKRLIDAEAGKQGLPLAHLADRLEIARPRLHKVIRKKAQSARSCDFGQVEERTLNA